MSDPQQPGQPSRDGAVDPAATPTPPSLPAEPQYPGAQAPAPGAPYAPGLGGGHVFPTATPQASPTAIPQPSPTAPGFVPGSAGIPPYGAPAPSTSGNGLGRAAFIVALVTLAIDVFLILARPFVYMSDRTYSLIGLIEGASGILTFLGYGAALVLGLIAARRPGPRLLAGIAIGISGAGLLTIVLSWLSSTFYGFL
ncbi:MULTISPECIES: hypothetical protein [Microbacterium]|jgi:hypothetical protein|uniref:Uncharacterized protein n=1 Tax=Microbacterium paraoxydans TaxID=199592 RepID=A0A1H1RWY2_9MICO|nr:MULTISPECIES: hypothetical protein [Microbacterium]AVL98431.1 hypothetical protein C6C15_15725 [Microbacterium sp. str. 'China']MCK2033026.1 hypothetical protein [Microbacterium sp. KSW4-4]MCT2225608.1 hypothetical protein [Microbacterium paraoxydans]SDS40242.1 hypothetical protein SAMN04489809_1776 [Microbacterium paraoxydans]